MAVICVFVPWPLSSNERTEIGVDIRFLSRHTDEEVVLLGLGVARKGSLHCRFRDNSERLNVTVQYITWSM